MSMVFHSEGAAGEVTGSRHILEADGERLLVDCGAFQGRRKEADEKNRRGVSEPERIDSVLLTHAHFDHCGMLPLLVKRGCRANIFATPATRDLAALIMMDSARIQARDAEYLAKQAAKRGERFDWKPLYDEEDVIRATGQFMTVSYNRPFVLSRTMKAEFFDAGHILGSAMAHCTATDGSGRSVRIGFTGDLGRKNKPIIRDPDGLPPVEYLVVEGTYGDRLHESAVDAMDRLAEAVKRTAGRGGKLLIPAFAVERTQELVFFLHLLADAGKIPSLPIWVDSPMAANATGIFQIHPECYDRETNEAFIKHHKNPFGFNGLKFAQSVQESKALNDLPGPAVIISSDGMCEAGRIQHHLIHNVGDPRATILIVGYMAADTLGRAIKERRSELRIHDGIHRLRAEVEEINAFSAHADHREIGEWMGRLDRSALKRVFLVHGEPAALAAQEKYLNGLGYKDVVIVKQGERYEL